MRNTIHGSKYNFHVVAKENKFYIQAVDKVSLRYSCINNLNSILSELVHDQYSDKRYSDSCWEVSQEKGEQFAKFLVKTLSSNRFRHYLENKLDEDRTLGEWENIKGKGREGF